MPSADKFGVMPSADKFGVMPSADKFGVWYYKVAFLIKKMNVDIP